MKKIWRKILAVACALSMFLTVPAMSALGAEEYDGEIAFVEEVLNDESQELNAVEAIISDESQSIEVDNDNQILEDKVVGAGTVKVGDGVTATFDKKTGTISLYSNGGTLWRDWIERAGYNRSDIKIIKVASGTISLPADSSGRHDMDDSDHMFSCCDNLIKIDLASFDTSKVENMGYMFFGCRSLATLDLSNFDTSNVTNMGDLFYGCINLKSIN